MTQGVAEIGIPHTIIIVYTHHSPKIYVTGGGEGNSWQMEVEHGLGSAKEERREAEHTAVHRRKGGEGRSSPEIVGVLRGDARAPTKAEEGGSGGMAWQLGCSAQGGGCRCLGSSACARPG